MMTMLTLSFATLFSVLYGPLSIVMLSMCAFLLALTKYNLTVPLTYGAFSMDSTSLLLVILSLWTTLLMLLTMNFPSHSSSLAFTMLSLMVILVVAFMMSNLISFYIAFEASLVPTFMLILGWGYQPERIQAGVYMLLYTVLASLPLLVALIAWKNSSGNCSILSSTTPLLSSSLGSLWAIALTVAFAVKLPLYVMHLWLPKAHVEAPVAGSMILAGVLLKLGGYGMLRMLTSLGPHLPSWSCPIITWSLVGGMVAGATCIRQTDVKALIAISSVAHMAMVMASLFTLTKWGTNGAILIMVGHGLCSSALFCIANMTYLRTHSRSFTLTTGTQSVAPTLTLWWFLLVAANMAAPPTLNLLGEMSSIISLFVWTSSTTPLLMWLVFFAAVYSLYLYASTQHGNTSSSMVSFHPPSPREALTLLLHWAPLNFLCVWSSVNQAIIC